MRCLVVHSCAGNAENTLANPRPAWQNLTGIPDSTRAQRRRFARDNENGYR